MQINQHLFWKRPIPVEWENARRYIASVTEHPAIIAGGALRDNILGIPIKDVDIFVLGLHSQMAYYLFGAERVENFEYDYGDHHARLANANILGVNVDLVTLSHATLKTVLENFDLGICRIAWDGYHLHITDDFMHDYTEKTITSFCRSVSDHRDRVADKLAPLGFKTQLADTSELIDAGEAYIDAIEETLDQLVA